MRYLDIDVSPEEDQEQMVQKRGQNMSIFAEYKHGQVDYDEFISVCRWEEAKDRYYEEHQFDEMPTDKEEGDEEND